MTEDKAWEIVENINWPGGPNPDRVRIDSGNLYSGGAKRAGRIRRCEVLDLTMSVTRIRTVAPPLCFSIATIRK
jgi:hypothetical protein